MHGLLSKRRWDAVLAADLVDGVVACDNPFGPSSLEVDGGGVRVEAERCQSLALVLHELAANACEHGAWSDERGVVRVSFEESGDGLTVRWAESSPGGASEPERLGTGLTLAGGFVRHDLRGEVDFDFAPGGLRVTMRLPRVPVVVTGAVAPSGSGERELVG